MVEMHFHFAVSPGAECDKSFQIIIPVVMRRKKPSMLKIYTIAIPMSVRQWRILLFPFSKYLFFSLSIFPRTTEIEMITNGNYDMPFMRNILGMK
jgi:hypothetical protein